MRRLVALAFLLPAALAAQARPAADTAWRTRVAAWADSALVHSAWGAAHARRDFALAMELARLEGVTVDEDALWAAAFVHDMGAFPAYATQGVDHGDVAAARAGEVLQAAGFPMAKLPVVQDAVSHHMYYHAPGTSVEARLLRDADTLDFLGAMGVARILSLTTRHRWAPTLPAGVATIRRLVDELPPTLTFAASRRLAEPKLAAMTAWLAALEKEGAGAP